VAGFDGPLAVPVDQPCELAAVPLGAQLPGVEPTGRIEARRDHDAAIAIDIAPPSTELDGGELTARRLHVFEAWLEEPIAIGLHQPPQGLGPRPRQAARGAERANLDLREVRNAAAVTMDESGFAPKVEMAERQVGPEGAGNEPMHDVTNWIGP